MTRERPTAINADDQVSKVAVVLWLVPIGCVAICTSYVLRARLALGYWPTYDHPDPKNLDWPVHHMLILISLLAVYPSLIVSAGCSLYLMYRRRWGVGVATLGTTALLYFALLTLSSTAAADEFFAWYMD